MFRNKVIKYLIISFAFLVLFIKLSFAATSLDPSLKWKTLETPHFLIHFYEQEEAVARKLAPLAEEVHEKLISFMKHQPGTKTHVVLMDTTDYGNGYATVLPDPRIIIYLTDWSSNLNPSKYDHWLKFVFTHEYTHILHLDIADGLARLPRLIFGQIVSPNALSPAFILEGIATYSETLHESWGRGDDPLWDMMMRMDVLENNIKSIDQASVSTVFWPGGHLRYLYGVEFLQYLSQTYGEDKLIRLFHVYGDYLILVGQEGAFYSLYGKNLDALWLEWLETLKAKYEKQAQDLGQIRWPKLLTQTGYYNLKPKWDRDGNRIYYQQNNNDAYPDIRAIDLIRGGDETVFEGSVFDANLSFDPAGDKLLFSKLDTYDNYYSYRDLYFLELKTKNLKQITRGKRATDSDLSPKGDWLVYVENQLGTNRLMMMSSNGEENFTVSSAEAEVQYFSPRFSPDGKEFVVAKWLPGGDQKLYLVSPQSGKQKRVTQDTSLASEANPCFSPDGHYIYFNSDKSGIVNLYAFDLQTNKLFKITNILGGAMMPDVSPNGQKLAYVSYSSRGYDIAVMDVARDEWQEVREELGGGEVRKVERGALGGKYDIKDYSPLPSLRPKFWLPLTYVNENGAQTSIYTWGSDALNQHSYYFIYGYDFAANKPQYNIYYANNQFLPQIELQVSDASTSYSWENTTLWMNHKYGLLSASLYDNRVFSEWDRQVLAVGYEQTNISNISAIGSYATPPSLGNVKGMFVAWKYSNARKYAKSISYEDGINLNVKVTANSRALGSDYAYTNYAAKVYSYFTMPRSHHVLTPALYSFYSSGDQLAQNNFSWEYLPIRGYSSTDLKGNKGVSLATEYRFPLMRTEKSVYYGSVFLDKLWVDVFFDMGGATLGSLQNMQIKRSFGFELNCDALFFGYFYYTIKFGYVQAMDTGGENKVYFSLGLF